MIKKSKVSKQKRQTNWFFLKNPNWVLINMRVSWSVTGDRLNSNYVTTQIHFPIGGERVTCPGSKLTYFQGKTKLANSLGKQQLELSTREWSGRAPWTAANWCASRRQENIFFEFVCWVGRQNRKLNDWPCGKHSVLFPFDLHCSPRRKQWVLFPLDPPCSLRNVNQKKTKLYQMSWY